MKPLIGITSEVKNEDKHSTVEYVEQEIVEAVEKSGGLPVFLPNLADKKQINELALKLDGLILTGGGDVDPTLFGEEPHRNLKYVSPKRDLFEMSLAKIYLEMNKPILGICRGSQIINITLGGDIFQDIYEQFDSVLLQHDQKAPKSHLSHYITLNENSLFYSIINQNKIKVNSYHHQAIRKLGIGVKESAVAGDNVIEAIESETHDFVIGVQWHPEYLYKSDASSKKLFKAFVDACQ